MTILIEAKVGYNKVKVILFIRMANPDILKYRMELGNRFIFLSKLNIKNIQYDKRS